MKTEEGYDKKRVSMQENKKYRKGIVCVWFKEINNSDVEYLRRCKQMCDWLIVGIPSNELLLYVESQWPENEFLERKKWLLEISYIDEVIPIDTHSWEKSVLFNGLDCDVCFVGHEYGQRYLKDTEYLHNRGVAIVPLWKTTLSLDRQNSALEISLREAALNRKKIVLWGTGKYFEQYMKVYGRKYPPAYAVDIDRRKWNTCNLGTVIYPPEKIMEYPVDEILVIFSCKSYKESLGQLCNLGKYEYRSLFYQNDAAILEEHFVNWKEEQEYLEKAHEILVKLMKLFDEVCSKYKLRYYVTCGSLIGVVRHKGLIPWDDDIDIAMPRKDFEILKKRVKEWQTDELFLLNYNEVSEDSFYDFVTRIIYSKERIPTGCFQKTGGQVRKGIKDRMFLDIFILDNMTGNIGCKISTALLKCIYALAMGHRKEIDFSEYDKLPPYIRMLLKIAVKIGKTIPLKVIFFLYDAVSTLYDNRNCKYYYESNSNINYIDKIYEKRLYDKGVRLPMGDLKVNVPTCYDVVLEQKGYHNYMELPAVHYRRPTHTRKSGGVLW